MKAFSASSGQLRQGHGGQEHLLQLPRPRNRALAAIFMTVVTEGTKSIFRASLRVVGRSEPSFAFDRCTVAHRPGGTNGYFLKT
jgi:hypothetical protein